MSTSHGIVLMYPYLPCGSQKKHDSHLWFKTSRFVEDKRFLCGGLNHKHQFSLKYYGGTSWKNVCLTFECRICWKQFAYKRSDIRKMLMKKVRYNKRMRKS